MRILTAWLLVISTTACAREPQNPSVIDGFAWRGFAQAIVEAPASKKMILVDVYTDW